jgi:multiple sugar transport system substrate-binding protein
LYAADPERSTNAGNIEVGPEPSQYDARTPHVTGCWLLGIPRESRNAEAALELVLWLTSREQQRRMALERIMPPTRASVMRDTAVVEVLPFMPAVVDALQHAVPRPRSPHFPAVEQILGRYLNEGIRGQITAEEVAAHAQEEIRALLVREGVLE